MFEWYLASDTTHKKLIYVICGPLVYIYGIGLRLLLW